MEDREGPSVKNIKIEKNSLSPGDTSYISFELDDKSTIIESSVAFYKKNTNDPFRTYIPIRQDDGSYICGYSIDNQWYNGEYDIRIYSVDRLQNESFELINDKINVSNSPEDHKPPEVRNVDLDKNEVTPGDVLTVKTEVTDDSIIDHVYGALFYDGKPILDDEYPYDEAGNENYKLFIFYRDEDGNFTTHIDITHKYQNGDYSLKLYTMDQWGNYEDHVETDAVFTVSESLEHFEGPVITSVLFDKTECVPGDTFTLTAKAFDDVDEIVSIKVWLGESYGEPSDRYNQHLYMTLYPDENGTFSATEFVDNIWANNTYEIYYMEALDKAGNKSVYDEDLLYDLYINKEIELNFLTVTDSTDELSELQLSEIKFDKDIVNIGDTINITAKTTGNIKAKQLVLELSERKNEGIVWDKKVYICR